MGRPIESNVSDEAADYEDPERTIPQTWAKRSQIKPKWLKDYI